MRIHKLRSDIACGVRVRKDDLDIGAGDQGVFFGYAVGETGDTDVRSWMNRLDAVTETAILYELKLGAMVTALRTRGFGVETLRGFTVGLSTVPADTIGKQ